MPAAPIPSFDGERLEALSRYSILDTDVEEVFDRITIMAKSLFNVPIAVISLVDKERQWFKSIQGLDARETPRDQAFCSYAILQPDVLVVEDATQDPRFADNPLVLSDPMIRFYAGAQLVTHDGHRLGTLCIIDKSPRQFLDTDARMLKDLATMAMNEIELRIASANDYKRKQFVTRDKLTDAYNSRTFRKLFAAECARAQGRRTPLSLAIFHIDHLQSLGDLKATPAVECVVKSFRETCNGVSRPGDILARVSADGFTLLMPNTKSESAEIVVRRILKRVETDTPQTGDGQLSYSVSVGLAQLSANQKDRDLYKEAERNLCAAQETGRNNYVSSFAA